MNLTEYERRHVESLKELDECRRVCVYQSECGPIEESVGGAQDAFEKIFSWQGIRLDQRLQRCFLRFEGISSHWRLELGESHVSGEFSLRHLAAAMLTVGTDADTEYSTDEESQIYSELRIFDDQPYGGGDTFAALRISPGMVNPEIWYHDGPLGVFRMDLDYCTYLDSLLTTKGAYGWQHLFTTAGMEHSDVRTAMNSMRCMLEIFPQVFPDHDYAGLRTRLEERL
ncbi:hypothetical protein [Streptomyces sp. NPDC057418]|uniref:hypothetical protein n=1 Tax=Streptomyces sp. NPDC057418 TaxID=3346126 RepID=UPI0036CE6404